MRFRTWLKLQRSWSSATVGGKCLVFRPGPRREHIENVFAKQGNGIPRRAQCVSDSVGNGRGWTIHWELADSFRAKGAVDIAYFLKEHPDRRQVRRCRHNVVRHLGVLHAPILPNHFLIKAEAYSLSDATGDLSSSKDRVENAANFLQRDEVVHRYAVRRQVNSDCSDINRPGKCRVCFSAVFLIIPENAGRRLITCPRAELSVRSTIVAARRTKLFRRV